MVFRVIKPRVRLPSMESQRDHRKADEEKQACLGDRGVFFIVLYHTKPSLGGTQIKNTGLKYILGRNYFFI